MSQNLFRLKVPRLCNGPVEGYLDRGEKATKTHRGVRASQASRMINSAFYGEMLRNPALKNEFVQECLGLERRD